MVQIKFTSGSLLSRILNKFRKGRHLKWSLQLNDSFLKYNETASQLSNDEKVTEQLVKIFTDQAPYPFEILNKAQPKYNLKKKMVTLHFTEYKSDTIKIKNSTNVMIGNTTTTINYN